MGKIWIPIYKIINDTKEGRGRGGGAVVQTSKPQLHQVDVQVLVNYIESM